MLTSERSTSDYFDQVISFHNELKKEAKIVVNWITTELFAILKKQNISINNSPISPDNLGQLIRLIISDKISGKIAKDVLEEMFHDSKSPERIVNEKRFNSGYRYC